MARFGEPEAARAALARHVADGASLHLPSDRGLRLRALVGMAIVATSLLASGLSPLVGGAAAAEPAQSPAAVEQLLDGAVDLNAPLTEGVAAKIIEGVKESLYREVPEARGRVDFMNLYGGNSAKQEAERIVGSLGMGSVEGESRDERLKWLQEFGEEIGNGGSRQGTAAQFERGTGGTASVSGGSASDRVCVVALAIPKLDVGGRDVAQPTGVFLNNVLHEGGHCLQAVLRDGIVGMSSKAAAAPGSEAYMAGIRGEAHAEAFAHHVMGMNGAGAGFMQARVLATEALAYKNFYNPALLAYRFMPLLQDLASEYSSAPAAAFEPHKITGIAAAFDKAGETALKHEAAIADRALAEHEAAAINYEDSMHTVSASPDAEAGMDIARASLDWVADNEAPELAASRQAAAEYAAWVAGMRDAHQGSVAPATGGAADPAVETALRADTDAGARIVGAAVTKRGTEVELVEPDGTKTFALVTDKAVLRYDADRHNVSLSADRPAAQGASGTVKHRIADDQGNIVAVNESEAASHFAAARAGLRR